MLVLQVDDDPKTTDIVEEMLRLEGHTCHSTNSGQEALQLSKHDDYDVILLDIMLPDIDGYEVLRRLREAGDPTPIVIQSGLFDRTISAEGPNIGVTDYLLKPFNKGELMERLRSATARAKAPIGSGAECQGALPETARILEGERRSEKRLKSLKAAKIAYGSGLDCLVRNLSHGGAEIQLSNHHLDCPTRFALRFRSGAVHQCEVRWRAGERLGVKFVMTNRSDRIRPFGSEPKESRPTISADRMSRGDPP